MIRHVISALLLATGMARVTHAQKATTTSLAPATQPPEPGSELTVTLVTFGQGEEVPERFGHNALLLYDARTVMSTAYHWGLYDFQAPHFIARFISGDARYSMGPMDGDQLIAAERAAGREVTLQRLNLTPPQRITLRDYVRWNARDENKFYRYDYFKDNCSTRLRDALDHALDGALKRAADTVVTALTYRRESVRLTDGDAPIQVGIDIALGRPADEPLTAWDSFFIPMRLRDAIRGTRIPQHDGSSLPLVEREQKLPLVAEGKHVIEAPVAPRLTPELALIGILLAALVVVLRLLMARSRSAAWALALLGSAWSLLCGLLGVILLLVWFATQHVFWALNENVLLLTPLSLALVPLIPMAVLRGRAERPARMIASLIVTLALVSFVLALIPGGQESRAIVALIVPVHLALAWALSLPRHATQLL